MRAKRLLRRTAHVLALLPLPMLGWLGANQAQAGENYALIVTASDYPNLPKRDWLEGPKNDGLLVRDYLLHNAPVPFKPENVTLLGSGDGLELATHQRILDDLAKIAAEAQPGDFVFLQFSGHGSQQPALHDPSETDGRDEVFLSADTQMAPDGNPILPNALVDDEVATALKAIRIKQASVWVVFDSCHSGTMTRDLSDQRAVMREIKPADLNIPDSAFTMPAAAGATPAPAAAAAGAEPARTAPLPVDVFADDPKEGPLVAFFAAQTNEEAPETAYDVAGPNGTTAQENYGVFTHAIFSALAKNPNMSYRQLAQSVLASYVADNWLRVTPLFEGKLDGQVFSNTDVVPTEQWPVTVDSKGGLSLSAGQLQGLSAGSTLLLVPSPAATNDQALGVVQVASTTQLRATIVPGADATHPQIDATAIPAGTYARLQSVTYPFELKVAQPDPALGDPDQVKAVDEALDAIAADPDKQLKMTLVPPGGIADVQLRIMSDAAVSKLAGATADATRGLTDAPKLWLLPATGEISLDEGKRAPAMALAGATAGGAPTPEFTKTLEKTLTTIFRATGLSQLTAENTFAKDDFALSFSKQAAGSDTLEPMAIEDTPMIRPNDLLYVDFTNSSGKPVDINLLYIDHDYGITPVCASHLATGGRLFQPFAQIEASDAGAERLVAVINESGKDLTDLSFLGQSGLGSMRGLQQPGLLGMLADLGDGVQTRATAFGARDPKVPRGAVVMMPLEALAPTGAAPADPSALKDAPPLTGECKN